MTKPTTDEFEARIARIEARIARIGARIEEQAATTRAMLAALKHARSILMASAENGNRHSKNPVWVEIKDAIAQAEAAGKKANASPNRASKRARRPGHYGR